ncbi:MAG: sigma-54-dependent transcriptional regulator [Opitutaceae bacterium]
MPPERPTGLSVLVVEDESLSLKRYTALLEGNGADVTAVRTKREAASALAGIDFDVVLLDVNLPDGKGTDLLRDKKIAPGTTVIVMTAAGGVAGAVEAMRLGATDYLAKPFDAEELPVRIAKARRTQQTRRVEEFRRESAGASLAEELVFGRSLAGVEEKLRMIIAADERRQTHLPPVLIEGETGTGKTTIARWLHQHGPRAQGPLVEVNCSALPEALAESELFGHERGAFTDASAARIGLMEAADGGTLFLDELPSLSPTLQSKILTAIDDHAIRRVGSNRSKRVDARIIAATNVDLRERVAAGRFREDLLHRLDLFRVRIPPLRERGDDLFVLADELVARIGRHYGLTAKPIPAEGRARLRAHAWTGNVRELAHAIERELVFAPGGGLIFSALERDTVAGGAPAAAWLRADFVLPESGFSLDAATRELIQLALRQTSGNMSAAARMLGVTRDYMRYHLRHGAADPPDDLGQSAQKRP